MRAVVMAGGRGTRMLPFTTVLPKALLPVGERPILALLLEQLARAGVARVDLCVGYLGELIRAYFAQSPPTVELEIEFHTEAVPLGTAGGLRTIEGLDEPFLALNADVLTNLDFADLLRRHCAAGDVLTVAAKTRQTIIGAGVLDVEGDHIVEYVEKPVLSHLVSLGIYAVSPTALGRLPEGPMDMPAFVEALLRAGEPVGVYRFDGEWFDIGTPAEHEQATSELAEHPERY